MTDASVSRTHLLLEHLDTLSEAGRARLLAVEGLRLDLLDLERHGGGGGEGGGEKWRRINRHQV